MEIRYGQKKALIGEYFHTHGEEIPISASWAYIGQLVMVYAHGFGDGVKAAEDALGGKAEQDAMPGEDSVQIDWEDIKDILGKVKGIGEKTMNTTNEIPGIINQCLLRSDAMYVERGS